nr:ATPase, T2SS/T4P/T4SS family [Serratia quinivorans]
MTMDVKPLPFAWAQQQGVLYRCQDGQHQLLFRTGASAQALLEARRVLPACRLLQLEPADFEQALLRGYQQDESLPDSDDGTPIIGMLNAMLTDAIKGGASDIHIEPFECRWTIRFRIDGVLRSIHAPQHQLTPVLVSRIKVMAKLDMAEKRLPQYGRITLRVNGRTLDVRVSTLPTSHGERVVLRLRDKNTVKRDLGHLGLNIAKYQALEKLLLSPHGLLLVTGPVGSGKSTTLYAVLNRLHNQQRSIMTIEDPVDYPLEGIRQTQVNPKIGMTFARGLRAILRQDPDVVMIGEIRDGETAKIAVQASLTGHLVLSTLHTNSAIGAICRLRDMGVEPFLLGRSPIGVLDQRLVRTLCNYCRQPHKPDDERLRQAGLSPLQPPPWRCYRPVGCERCNFSGYRGRTGIHVLLSVDDRLRQAIARGDNEPTLAEIARRHNQGIRQDGLEKVLNGQTTLEEVLRVTREN